MPRSPTSGDADLVDGLFQLSFHLHATLARLAAEHELSLIQVRLLGILRDREPAMLALARHLALEKSSLSGLVDRAEKRGLVERFASASDGRASHVRITAQGRKLSRAIEDAVTAEVRQLVAVLAKADRDRLARLVAQIIAGTNAGGALAEPR
jgi:DNA-binding MarR family transcriptional regulator